jgi:crooked neck
MSAAQGRAESTFGIKNKSAAKTQITAEQILRDAQQFVEPPTIVPRQVIQSEEDLAEYRGDKRRSYENGIRANRNNMGCWKRYALWEATQNQFERARSVFERALEVDMKCQMIWVQYVQMETSNKFINHARNLWDRVTTHLPRVDKFWYKYVYLEERLENYGGVRKIFDRWLSFKPGYPVWEAFVQFEVRHKQLDSARNIYNRMRVAHTTPQTYIQYARFEMKLNQQALARQIFEQAFQDLDEDVRYDEGLFNAFAEFETFCGEYARAREVYKFALDHLSHDVAERMYVKFSSFEKRYGSIEDIDSVVLSKRRLQYEDDVKANPLNYDVWFDYLRLEESKGRENVDTTRELYERAIANVPPTETKPFWKRYIYLWINFALFEELIAQDLDRCEQVLKGCIAIIPHKQFTFAKVWIQFAQFYVRRKQLGKARQVFGNALGQCPRKKVFAAYIAIESALGNIDRCRTLHEKHIEFAPDSSQAWVDFAVTEASLAEFDRSRGLFELAVQQDEMDMPEIVWKTYIDFEAEHGTPEAVRALYTRLIDKTHHVKVYISFVQYEASIEAVAEARAVLGAADAFFKQEDAREERALILETWNEFEGVHGSTKEVEDIQKMQPIRVKKKRRIVDEDNVQAGWEEYWDYQFADEAQAAKPGLKLLAKARAWKKKQMEEAATNGSAP